MIVVFPVIVEPTTITPCLIITVSDKCKILSVISSVNCIYLV